MPGRKPAAATPAGSRDGFLRAAVLNLSGSGRDVSAETERTESWIEVLASVVAGLRSSQGLSELAAQAREALAELRSQAGGGPGTGRDRDEVVDQDVDAAGTDGEESVAGLARDPDALAVRLDGLSASLEEISDLLDAGLERLETVEIQLGDPDENVDAQVSEAVARCESHLAGIEHRLGAAVSDLRAVGADSGRPAAQGRSRMPAGAQTELLVLVVDADSERRCARCVALEHQGLRCLAAADAGAAALRFVAQRPGAILIDIDTAPGAVAVLAAALEASDPALPAATPVLVMSQKRLGRSRAAVVAEVFGAWPLVFDTEGAAALAAAVIAAARERAACDVAEVTPEVEPEVNFQVNPMEEATRHASDTFVCEPAAEPDPAIE